MTTDKESNFIKEAWVFLDEDLSEQMTQIDTRAVFEIAKSNISCFNCLKSVPLDVLSEMDSFTICEDCMHLLAVQNTFKCEICLSNCDFVEMQTFDSQQDCGHLFCVQCLSEYVESAINSSITPKNLSLPCPGVKCECLIEPSQIFNLLSEPSRQKYTKIQLLAFTADYQAEANLQSQVLIFCPDCEIYGCFQKRTDPFTCQTCVPLQQRCALCWSKEHTGQTCQVKNSEYLDQLFQELLTNHQCIQCPACKYAVQKVDGCQNMVCRSPVCGGTTTFCYGCGIDFKAHTQSPLCLRP